MLSMVFREHVYVRYAPSYLVSSFLAAPLVLYMRAGPLLSRTTIPGLEELLLGSGLIGLGKALVNAEMISIDEVSESVSLSLPVDISVSMSELEESLEPEREPEEEDKVRSGCISMSAPDLSSDPQDLNTPRPSLFAAIQLLDSPRRDTGTHHLDIRLSSTCRQLTVAGCRRRPLHQSDVMHGKRKMR